MELLFNECSLHGQFEDIDSFEKSLDLLMNMRLTTRKYGREIQCHRQLINSLVTQHYSLPQIIQRLDKNKASALRDWIGRTGPYWDEPRQHSPDEYFECNSEIVTDTAIGECAYRHILRSEAQLASISPSNWQISPVEVIWHNKEQKVQTEKLINHVTIKTLEDELKKFDAPPASWAQLDQTCRRKFENLVFSNAAFAPLNGVPFVFAAAQSMLDLLSLLNKFKQEHNLETGRSKEGDRMYQDYFTGPRAWYSDSSDREKRDFKNQMTFTHPASSNKNIFAPYHGKIQTPQMRIHFSWPITATTPLYILYVGDKITKY